MTIDLTTRVYRVAAWEQVSGGVPAGGEADPAGARACELVLTVVDGRLANVQVVARGPVEGAEQRSQVYGGGEMAPEKPR